MDNKKENQEKFNSIVRIFNARSFDSGDLSKLSTLLKDSSPELLEMQDKYGRTLLHVAIDHARVEAVELISKKSTSDVFSIKDQDGLTPLEKAKRNFHTEFDDSDKRFRFKAIEHVVLKEMRNRNLLKESSKNITTEKSL